MLKHISKLFVCLITICSLVVAITPVNVVAKSRCSLCKVQTFEIEKEYIDEDGNIVKIFEDGVEAIYMKNGEIILRDYYNVFETDSSEMPPVTRALTWIAIGKAIISAAGTCSSIDYITGHDVCRIVLSKLGTSAKPKARYELTGRHIPGYIPGCEPRHSGPCNAGYWEYRIVPL